MPATQLRPAPPPHRAAWPQARPARPGWTTWTRVTAQIRAVIGKLRKVIGKDIPVMVLGETGTGKN